MAGPEEARKALPLGGRFVTATLVLAFLGGAFFAILQFCYFVLLEWQLSSAWTTYVTVSLAWMAGILLGLCVRLNVREGKSLRFLNIPCYYGLWMGLHAKPFDNRLLPLYALCVLFSGTYAGYFFRSTIARSGETRGFLLWENNGFLAGLLLSFLCFSADGLIFLAAGPLVSVLLLAASEGSRNSQVSSGS
jgi:hypothetical protein